LRNIWDSGDDSGDRRHAEVLGNYVSASVAPNGKKGCREIRPTPSNCSEECGLRFSKWSQPANACSCSGGTHKSREKQRAGRSTPVSSVLHERFSFMIHPD